MFNFALGFSLLWGLQGVELQTHIRGLGDDSFPKREASQAAIMKMMDTRGREVYLTLQRQMGRETDPEIPRRMRFILEEYRSKSLGIDLGGYPALPWIDMLPPDYKQKELCGETIKELARHEVIDKYLSLGRTAVGGTCSFPDWLDYRAATDFWLSTDLHSWFNHWLANAKNEEEFRREVFGKVRARQGVVNAMIDLEDKYWLTRNNQPNPLRKRE